MVMVAIVLAAVIIPTAQQVEHQTPRGMGNVLEVLVIFVRDMIARPASHEKADAQLPFLLTMFVYILSLNLLGMVPLEPIAHVLNVPKIGHTATGIPTVCTAWLRWCC